MKILFSCSNPYQIMISILLQYQISEKNTVSNIIITDTFPAAENISEKLKGMNIFNKVYLVRIKDIIKPQPLKSKLTKISKMLFWKQCVTDEGIEADYDKFFFNCEDIWSYNVISYLKIVGEQCEINRYEEGFSSYTNLIPQSQKSKNIITFRNRLYAKSDLLKYDNFYVFNPDLLQKKYDSNIIKINNLIAKQEKYQNAITDLFKVKKEIDKYNGKFIIFEDGYSADGCEVNDYEIYEKIIRQIGPEKFVLKMHPRSTQNRFERLGIEVYKPNGIPWEAIVLSGKIENVTMFTFGSGSVINSRFLLNDNSKAVLLAKLLRNPPKLFDENYMRFIDKFSQIYRDGLFIPSNMDELDKYINQI